MYGNTAPGCDALGEAECCIRSHKPIISSHIVISYPNVHKKPFPVIRNFAIQNVMLFQLIILTYAWMHAYT